MTVSSFGAFLGASEKSSPVTLPSSSMTVGASAGGSTSLPSGPSSTSVGWTETMSTTKTASSAAFSFSCGAPCGPQTSSTGAVIASRVPRGWPTISSRTALKSWSSEATTWIGTSWS